MDAVPRYFLASQIMAATMHARGAVGVRRGGGGGASIHVQKILKLMNVSASGFLLHACVVAQPVET